MPSIATQIGLWESYFDYQRTYMALRNFAEATRRGYASDLRLFLRCLADKVGVRTANEVERTHLHEYFAELDRRGQAGATRARKLAAVESFLDYLEDAAITAYLSSRPSQHAFPVFLSNARGRLTSRAIQRIVKKYMERAGISGASVHTLRHTFATHMVREGTNLRVIQEAPGHASLQTTSLYVSLARDLMDQQLQANAL